ncbi:hypothetical protein FA95DRAFT_1584907 [Auriscalpium vulgare]|uniref:Uncharacterized protein n=1 Tax=Auriscalpium vulgare TaxID=40419 RepID=A0ACB8RAN6_9AGAM|nr:hypothetical protein FA95DRAFT_1584907 [Auriscalpium vulgare]
MMRRNALPSTSEAFVDSEQRVLAQMAGKPQKAKDWPEVHQGVSRQMKEVLKSCEFKSEDHKHQRGQYPVLRAGFTYGGGPKEPYNVAAKIAGRRRARRRLLRHHGLQRIAQFQSSALSVFNPRMYVHLDDVVADVQARDPSLKKAFKNSVFPVATFNFGPAAVTKPHRDARNVPYGWCAITALGNYDYTKGGHLVLWELKLIIEFPPGCTILIPSALLTHSNTPIQAGEERQSFTQYCAGDLMRWHAYGCRTEERLGREDPQLKRRLEEGLPRRWREAVGLFPKWTEQQKDLRDVRS